MKEVFLKRGKKEWAVEKEKWQFLFFSSPPHIFLSHIYPPPTHVQFPSLEILTALYFFRL